MSSSISEDEMMTPPFPHDQYRRIPCKLSFALSYADWWSRSKTALATVCRGLGVDVGAVTTPRASARTTRQTSFVYRAFRWMEGAHPSILLNLLRRN
jgi:hypothetical protein